MSDGSAWIIGSIVFLIGFVAIDLRDRIAREAGIETEDAGA